MLSQGITYIHAHVHIYTYIIHEQDDTVHAAVVMQTQEAYVCPRRIDCLVYDQEAGEYVACAGEDDRRESMLDLSAEEAKSLQ